MDTKVNYEINMNGGQNNIKGVAVLKHCPFCGSTDLDLFNTHTASCWVECGGCGSSGNGRVCQTKTGRQNRKHFLEAIVSAVEIWNTRVS